MSDSSSAEKSIRQWESTKVRTLIALAAPLVPFGLFVLVPAVWSLPKPKSNAISH